MKSKVLRIKIITLFPKFIEDFLENFGIVKRAVKLKLLDIKPVDLRQFGLDRRKTVDNPPYGGGVGMVLRADVLHKAIQTTSKSRIKDKRSRIVLLTPQGQNLNQQMAQRLAKYDELIFVCGRYEGFDERIRQFVDEEISIGDYVLMGGELPALVISEAVMRLRPGILGKDESADKESFADNLLEYPQYTKPEQWKVSAKGGSASGGKSGKLKGKTLGVPKVLLTGHHKNIEEFRKMESEKRTKKRRPDLLEMAKMT
jgi:tRNA (guanine37-N1)-methyltransferase